MATTVLTDMKPRLEAAAAAVRSAKDKHLAELEVRDQLVVAAVDQGMSQRVVARAAGVSVARVCAILLNSDPGD